MSGAALPWGSPDVSAACMACKVMPSMALGASENDAEERFVRADLRRKLRQMLSETDVRALDAALTARSFAEVGLALGYPNRKTAERRGKAHVIAAARNLGAALKKLDIDCP